TPHLNSTHTFIPITFTYSQKSLEVLDNKAEQDCAAPAYLKYVKQAIAVPTKEDSAYSDF
ncbi:MAG: hypothetical protein IJW91_00885, partial [Phascolarctobacterium sp.]|nr:hypothetical protein [Phascolarctobacterium sp.]